MSAVQKEISCGPGFWLSRIAILALYAAVARPVVGQAGLGNLTRHANSVVPPGLGVNIHFAEAKPGEMDMLALAGFRWVRMDLRWGVTEVAPGLYDFRPYDDLLADIEPHNIRLIFILDYTNPLYDGDLSPYTAAGRQAFARWAAAAASHFGGHGILWEIYNEPNLADFWCPAPDVQEYIELALAVGQAIRAVAPEEIMIGPATSRINLPFLEACFQAGLLNYWSAVSVHPYRANAPETVASEYRALRSLIAQYAHRNKAIPIISGEWGYSSRWTGMDESQQAAMLARQWLTNVANDIPISIWYDWRDDGADPDNPEDHFGVVRFAYYPGRDPVFDAKPAYQAARTVTGMLAGYQFSKSIPLGNDDAHVLLFSNEHELRLVIWSSAPAALTATIPDSPSAFRITDRFGAEIAPLATTRDGFTVGLENAPLYVTPETPSDLLRLLDAWVRVPQEAFAYAPKP